MANALKKINARVKALRKRYPKAKRSTLQKQAGREYKAGKLKGKRKKPAVKKRVAKRRKPAAKKTRVRVKRVTVVKIVRRRTRKKPAKVKKKMGRAVGKKDSILPMLIVGGLGLAAVYMLTKPRVTSNQYLPTGNYQRDNAANNILSYAMAAGLTVTAITKLIQALNNSTDAQVATANSNPAGYINQYVNAGD